MLKVSTIAGAAGGVGTSTVAAALALHLAGAADGCERVALVDATGTGDAHALLGLATTDTTALGALDVYTADGVPAALRAAEIGRAERVVIDAGTLGTLSEAPALGALVLVTTGSYSALRRAVKSPLAGAIGGLVMHEIPGRAIGRREVEDVLSRRTAATMPNRDAIARAMDAGVLAARMPEALTRTASELAAYLDAFGARPELAEVTR